MGSRTSHQTQFRIPEAQLDQTELWHARIIHATCALDSDWGPGLGQLFRQKSRKGMFGDVARNT